MMSTVVSKCSSVIVKPLIPLTMSDTTIKLCSLDKPNFPMAVLILYEHPISNAANTIKMALSQALVHYYPFSGRFVPGAEGSTSYIDCTTERGAEFVTASADYPLKQADKLVERSSSGGGGRSTGTSSLLDQLVGHYTATGYGSNDPLLSVQVTEFTCGGFIIGVTWSHAIADGAGIAQFLGAIGELARGMSPSIIPIRWDKAVSSLPPQPDPVLDVMMPSLAAHGYSFTKMGEHFPLAFLDVTIPWSFINRTKAEFEGQPCCTTFEVAAAVLWRCRTRATMASQPDDDDTLCALAFPVNLRKHVGAKDGYYGNCVVDKLVMASRAAVAGSLDIMELVKMIKQAKDQVTDDDLRFDEKKENASSSSRSKKQVPGLYNTLIVTSWRNIGFEEVDFGSGPPARVVWPVRITPPVPTCIMCPNKGEDGVGAVSACVKQDHANALLKEIAKFTCI